jgi:hypothetical protein
MNIYRGHPVLIETVFTERETSAVCCWYAISKRIHMHRVQRRTQTKTSNAGDVHGHRADNCAR